MKSWVEKHRPETFDEIAGNKKALGKIKRWAENWSEGDKAIHLTGPPGTGKTSTARAVANLWGDPINDINASTNRKADDVARMAEEARVGAQVLLLDEADSWPSRSDVTPLVEALESPACPVIIASNEHWNVPDGLKRVSTQYKFKLNKSDRKKRLKEIAKAEGVPIDSDDLDKLADRPGLRSAIQDLQLNELMDIPVGDDGREWESSEFELMDEIIQKGEITTGSARPPWLAMWLDQNVRKDYRGLEAGLAYDALSRADVHLGRALKSDYRTWKYAADVASSVADVRTTDPYTGWIRWTFPKWVQSSTPNYTNETPEATLFRQLKRHNEPGFALSGSYAYFRGQVLPVLQRLPPDERLDLAVDVGLSGQALEALGLNEKMLEEHLGYASPGEGLSPEEEASGLGGEDW